MRTGTFKHFPAQMLAISATKEALFDIRTTHLEPVELAVGVSTGIGDV